MNRFFVAGTYQGGDVVTLDGSDAHKIISVLRMRGGETIEAIDSTARRFTATVAIEGRRVFATLGEPIESAPEQMLHITVAQGVPKGQKMDFVVEKLTELGVARVIPLQSERAVVSDVSANKIERWRRLAKTAAQQCGRADIPEVTQPQRFDDLCAHFSDYDCVLFPWELADRTPLRERLPALVAGASRIHLVVGPEGGFSHAEAEAAQNAGAHLVSLGSRILRTETAALVLVASVNYALGA